MPEKRQKTPGEKEGPTADERADVHWTGHRARLGRTWREGSEIVPVEELVAELGAEFWRAQFRLEQVTRPDQAAYLG